MTRNKYIKEGINQDYITKYKTILCVANIVNIYLQCNGVYNCGGNDRRHKIQHIISLFLKPVPY